ncbi:MAG: hypothetical protein ABL911_04450 [Gallionella sp.]
MIIFSGAIALAALISTPNPNGIDIAVFTLFIAFLFALTFVLRESTEHRLSSLRGELNPKPMGIVLLLLGIFVLILGVTYLIGYQPMPTGEGRCRAICGIIILTTQIFGELTGRLVAGFIWLCIGWFLCALGYKLKNSQINYHSVKH